MIYHILWRDIPNIVYSYCKHVPGNAARNEYAASGDDDINSVATNNNILLPSLPRDQQSPFITFQRLVDVTADMLHDALPPKEKVLLQMHY